MHIFQEKFLSGVVSKTDDFVTLPILLKIANEDKWFVCLGVPDYSSYKQYHIQDSVTDLLLPDSKRHKDCSRLFTPTSKNCKSCHFCLSLQYYLSSCKRKHDSLTEEDRLNWQSISSTIPLDY